MGIQIITERVLKLNHYLIINKSYFNIMNIETFEEISTDLKKRVGLLEISVNNLMVILQDFLEVVELINIKKMVSEADIDESDKEDCNLIINNDNVSNTIDSLITTSKKKKKLNKSKSLLNRILSKRECKHAENIQKKCGTSERHSKDKKTDK